MTSQHEATSDDARDQAYTSLYALGEKVREAAHRQRRQQRIRDASSTALAWVFALCLMAVFVILTIAFGQWMLS